MLWRIPQAFRRSHGRQHPNRAGYDVYPARPSFQEKPYQLLVELVVRLVAHRQVQPSLLVHDALVMGECVKSSLAMVGSDAALPEAAKSHMAGGQMDDGVVDAAAAEAAAGGDLPDRKSVV